MRNKITITGGEPGKKNVDSSVNATTVDMNAGGLDRTFKVINQMMADGAILNYAVGGAVASFFYLEPDTTFDLDIFCVWQDDIKNGLVDLTPIYSYLERKGYFPQNTGVNIEGAEVQFLTVSNSLTDAALKEARTLDYEGVPIRVISPEYLVAIMLQIRRPKDYARIARFLEAAAFDPPTLSRVLSEHGLEDRWELLELLDKQLGQ